MKQSDVKDLLLIGTIGTIVLSVAVLLMHC